MAFSLLPGNLPLTLRRGVAFGPITIFCRNGLGQTFDLTGYQVFSIARTEIPSPNRFDLDPNIVNAVDGEIQIQFTDEETQRLFQAGEYEYDLVLQDGSGDRLGPFVTGRLTVEDTDTRV